MSAGVYSAAAGMVAAERLYEVATQNLAHLRVHGYRRRQLSFEAVIGPDGKSYPSLGEVRIDFTPGTYERTENPLDVAIEGEGFFVLEGPEGPVYTRAGLFQVDATGRLVSPAGYAVQGTGGPMVVPVQGGQVRIMEDGTVVAGDQVAGQLRVVRFDDPSRLQPVGPSLFAAPPGLAEQTVERPRLLPGIRETSNVDPITDLVQLILASRYYEAGQRAISAVAQAHDQTSNSLF